MIKSWGERTSIVANLLNPAFCGEIIRRFIFSYNSKSEKEVTFLMCFIVLPLLLHKETRLVIPKRTNSHIFTWIDSKDALFIDFPKRAKDMKQHTKEALLFLLSQNSITINEDSSITCQKYRIKKFKGDYTEEINEILNKADFLGKWLSKTGDIQTLFTFLRITP